MNINELEENLRVSKEKLKLLAGKEGSMSYKIALKKFQRAEKALKQTEIGIEESDIERFVNAETNEDAVNIFFEIKNKYTKDQMKQIRSSRPNFKIPEYVAPKKVWKQDDPNYYLNQEAVVNDWDFWSE
jgi:hypothetical protein